MCACVRACVEGLVCVCGRACRVHSHTPPTIRPYTHTHIHTYTLAYTHTLSPRPFFKTDAWSSVSAGMTEQVVSSAITQPLKNFALPLLTYGVVRVRLLMCAGEDV